MTDDVPDLPYVLPRCISWDPGPYYRGVGLFEHLPYGIWVCQDEWHVLVDWNYVPCWARSGDGATAVPIPVLPNRRGLLVEHITAQGYFFAGGARVLSRRARDLATTERLALEHAGHILRDFWSGRPVWRFVAQSDSMPVGIDRWCD